MPFLSLWQPVIVSAIAVFIASSVVHMLLRYHRADYRRLPDEEAVRAGLAKDRPAPGLYFVPYCIEPKEMSDPAMKERFEKGPVALITMMPDGPPKMPLRLAQWFVLSFLVSFTAAYVARHTLQPGADGLLVMRITGAVAFGCYGISHISDSIWKAQPWSNTLRALLDALIYAVVTGLVFRLMWPA